MNAETEANILLDNIVGKERSISHVWQMPAKKDLPIQGFYAPITFWTYDSSTGQHFYEGSAKPVPQHLVEASERVAMILQVEPQLYIKTAELETPVFIDHEGKYFQIPIHNRSHLMTQKTPLKVLSGASKE